MKAVSRFSQIGELKFMDLVFHRYASPFLLLDQVVGNDELSEFVNMLWDVTEEEREWEYFLAKVFDKII